MRRLDRFRPPDPGPTPLFLDTSALFPSFYERATEHDEMTAFFDALHEGRLPYRPLYVNQHVLAELTTLLWRRASHGLASRAAEQLWSSDDIVALGVGDRDIDETIEEFQRRYDAHASFTDHAIAVQARDRGVDCVLAYDGDFEALGLTTIPHWSS